MPAWRRAPSRRPRTRASPGSSAAAASRASGSLLSEGGDGIEQRGAARGVHAGDDAYAGAQYEADSNGPGRDARRERRGRGDDLGGDDAERDADRRAEQAERRGLDEELREDVAARRAECFANADFACALGDRDEHDVHDHERAHEEADGGKGRAEEEQPLLELREERERRVLGVEREVVGPARRQAARATQDLTSAFHGIAERRVGRLLHLEPVEVTARTDCPLQRRRIGRDRETVEGESEHRALLLQHADDRVGRAANAEFAPDGIEAGKEMRRDFRPDHHHLRAGADLLRHERPPARDVVLLDRVELGFRRDRLDLARAIVRRRRIERRLARHRRPAAGWQHRFHEVDLRLVDPRAPLKLPPLIVRDVVQDGRTAPEGERVHAEQFAGEIVLHVVAHPLHDRKDRDEEHHADHHAEQREEALELLHADGGERKADGFQERQGERSEGGAAPDYSYRKASTGSSFAARNAGSMPKSIPVSALAPNAATTAMGGTDAAIGVECRTTSATTHPTNRPIMAPVAVSVTASMRNCQRIVPRVAPSALRTPISRVRSVTEIIMIATTPTPPTSSPTADSAIITRKKMPKILLYVSNSLSCVMIAKFDSRPGRSPRITRSAAVTSSMAWSGDTPSRGFTAIPIHCTMPLRCRWSARIGITTFG